MAARGWARDAWNHPDVVAANAAASDRPWGGSEVAMFASARVDHALSGSTSLVREPQIGWGTERLREVRIRMHTGRIVSRKFLSPTLATLRVIPEAGGGFPEYQAGQYIALRRERCRLTRATIGPGDERRYIPDLDASGRAKLGPVTHPYSIASAPSETRRTGELEFYVILERDAWGTPGRLSGSLFETAVEGTEISYGDRAAGSFTLEKRAAGFSHVLLVASGTGLAPFVSMIREQHLRAEGGRGSDVP